MMHSTAKKAVGGALVMGVAAIGQLGSAVHGIKVADRNGQAKPAKARLTSNGLKDNAVGASFLEMEEGEAVPDFLKTHTNITEGEIAAIAKHVPTRAALFKKTTEDFQAIGITTARSMTLVKRIHYFFPRDDYTLDDVLDMYTFDFIQGGKAGPHHKLIKKKRDDHIAEGKHTKIDRKSVAGDLDLPQVFIPNFKKAGETDRPTDADLLKNIKLRIPTYFGGKETSYYHNEIVNSELGYDPEKIDPTEEYVRKARYVIGGKVWYLDEVGTQHEGPHVLHAWGVNFESKDTADWKYMVENVRNAHPPAKFTKPQTDEAILKKYHARQVELFETIIGAAQHMAKQQKKNGVSIQMPVIGGGYFLSAARGSDLHGRFKEEIFSAFLEVAGKMLTEEDEFAFGIYNAGDATKALKDGAKKLRKDGKAVHVRTGRDNGTCMLEPGNLGVKKMGNTNDVNDEAGLPGNTPINNLGVIVNAWDTISLIGNGGSLDPSVDGFVVANAPSLDIYGKPQVNNNHFRNTSYLHNAVFNPHFLKPENWIRLGETDVVPSNSQTDVDPKLEEEEKKDGDSELEAALLRAVKIQKEEREKLMKIPHANLALLKTMDAGRIQQFIGINKARSLVIVKQLKTIGDPEEEEKKDGESELEAALLRAVNIKKEEREKLMKIPHANLALLKTMDAGRIQHFIGINKARSLVIVKQLKTIGDPVKEKKAEDEAAKEKAAITKEKAEAKKKAEDEAAKEKAAITKEKAEAKLRDMRALIAEHIQNREQELVELAERRKIEEKIEQKQMLEHEQMLKIGQKQVLELNIQERTQQSAELEAEFLQAQALYQGQPSQMLGQQIQQIQQQQKKVKFLLAAYQNGLEQRVKELAEVEKNLQKELDNDADSRAKVGAKRSGDSDYSRGDPHQSKSQKIEDSEQKNLEDVQMEDSDVSMEQMVLAQAVWLAEHGSPLEGAPGDQQVAQQARELKTLSMNKCARVWELHGVWRTQDELGSQEALTDLKAACKELPDLEDPAVGWALTFLDSQRVIETRQMCTRVLQGLSPADVVDSVNRQDVVTIPVEEKKVPFADNMSRWSWEQVRDWVKTLEWHTTEDLDIIVRDVIDGEQLLEFDLDMFTDMRISDPEALVQAVKTQTSNEETNKMEQVMKLSRESAKNDELNRRETIKTLPTAPFGGDTLFVMWTSNAVAVWLIGLGFPEHDVGLVLEKRLDGNTLLGSDAARLRALGFTDAERLMSAVHAAQSFSKSQL